MNSANVQSHIPPPSELITQINGARIMAHVARLEGELQVLREYLTRFKQESDSTQFKVSFEVWNSINAFTARWIVNMANNNVNGIPTVTNFSYVLTRCYGFISAGNKN